MLCAYAGCPCLFKSLNADLQKSVAFHNFVAMIQCLLHLETELFFPGISMYIWGELQPHATSE